MPKVTVLIPCFNGAKYMAPMLSSLRAQTLKDFNVMLVNDGSTDESSAVFAELTRRDRRFSLVEIAQNQGIVNALNTGLERSDSELIARLDVDDMAHPLRLEIQQKVFREESSIGLVGSAVNIINDAGLNTGVVCFPTYHRAISIGLAEGRFVIAHPAVMVRRELVARLGGYEQQTQHAEDLDLWLRLLNSGCKFKNLSSRLTNFRVHDSNDTILNTATQKTRKLQVLSRCYVNWKDNETTDFLSESVEAEFFNLQRLEAEPKGLPKALEESLKLIHRHRWDLYNGFYFHHFVLSRIKRALWHPVIGFPVIVRLPQLLFMPGVLKYLAYFFRHVLPVQIRTNILNSIIFRFYSRK